MLFQCQINLLKDGILCPLMTQSGHKGWAFHLCLAGFAGEVVE